MLWAVQSNLVVYDQPCAIHIWVLMGCVIMGFNKIGREQSVTKLHELLKHGQSIWYDNISRELLNDGTIAHWIGQGVRGMTSNPTIFEKAINGSAAYDADLARLAGKPAFEVYETLAFEDIGRAADLLRPIYDESGGLDGYISLEVSPQLAHDTQGTLEAVRRYAAALNRPNLMIKIPATAQGIPAIRQAISEGYNINVTLMFSLAHYDAVTEAYIAGLEELVVQGGDASKVASVASFFVSRVDSEVDKALAKVGNTALQGKIAIANSRVTYARFKETFSGARWEKLAAKGARVQRPLWASTGTKNPVYPDTLYVDTLIGAHTVNTVPTATLEAFLDHGTVAATVENDLEAARAQLAELAALGIDLNSITEDLQTAGVKAFADSFVTLLSSIEQKVPA